MQLSLIEVDIAFLVFYTRNKLVEVEKNKYIK